MAIIKGGANISGGGQSGIKWNIKPVNDVSEIPESGSLGDIYVITNKDIKSLKNVANIFDGYDLVDNSINIFVNSATTLRRINYYCGWYFEENFNSQTILLNGQGLYCPVYFWDALANNGKGAFVSIQVSYSFKDKFNIDNITLKSLSIDLWKDVMFEESIESKLPNVIKHQLFEELSSNNLSLETLDINLWNEFTYEENKDIKVLSSN